MPHPQLELLYTLRMTYQITLIFVCAAGARAAAHGQCRTLRSKEAAEHEVRVLQRDQYLQRDNDIEPCGRARSARFADRAASAGVERREMSAAAASQRGVSEA